MALRAIYLGEAPAAAAEAGLSLGAPPTRPKRGLSEAEALGALEAAAESRC